MCKGTSTGPAAGPRSIWCYTHGRLWAVEIKRRLSPRPEKGFHVACADHEPARRFVVYPGEETYPLGNDTWAVSLPARARQVAGASP